MTASATLRPYTGVTETFFTRMPQPKHKNSVLFHLLSYLAKKKKIYHIKAAILINLHEYSVAFQMC